MQVPPLQNDIPASWAFCQETAGGGDISKSLLIRVPESSRALGDDSSEDVDEGTAGEIMHCMFPGCLKGSSLISFL